MRSTRTIAVGAITLAAALGLAAPAGAGGSVQFAGATRLCNPSTPEVIVTNDFVYEHQTAELTVSLSKSACTNVVVDYTTWNSTWSGAAKAGTDYIAQSGSLTFTPGQTSKVVEIDIVDDSLYESDEPFYVWLTDAANADIADSLGKVTIAGLEPAG